MIVIGIPILRMDVCSESQASFTCIVTDSSTALLWDVDFLSGSDINRVTFVIGDPIGREFSPMNRGTGIVYKFNLTSKSPLTSTMITNTPTDLSGATVSCSDGFHRYGYTSKYKVMNILYYFLDIKS